MIAVGWCRVSKQEQAGPQHYSLAAQADAIRRFCADRGWTLADMVEYVGSGGHHAEALDALRRRLADLRADVLVVHELDRLGRDLVLVLGFLEDLTRAGCRFASVQEPDLDLTTPDGELRLMILGTFAQFFRRQLSRKVRAGLVQRWKAGKTHGGQPPYGYRHGGPDGRWVIDPVEATVVRDIFRRYRDGWGYRRIAAWLNQTGVPGKSGRVGTWECAHIQRMLANPVYAGDLVYGARRIVRDRQGRSHTLRLTPRIQHNTHPAIIDPALWGAVQEQRTRRQVLGQRARPSPTVLTGLGRCAACGHPMTVRRRQGRAPIWLCRYRHTRGTCRAAGVPLAEAEAAVRAALAEEIVRIDGGDPATILRWAADHPEIREWWAAQERHRQSAVALADKLRRAEEAYLAGVYTLEEYEAARARLRATPAPSRPPLSPGVRDAARAACRAAADWTQPEVARALLRRAGLQVVAGDGRIDVTWSHPQPGQDIGGAGPGPHVEVAFGGAEPRVS